MYRRVCWGQQQLVRTSWDVRLTAGRLLADWQWRGGSIHLLTGSGEGHTETHLTPHAYVSGDRACVGSACSTGWHAGSKLVLEGEEGVAPFHQELHRSNGTALSATSQELRQGREAYFTAAAVGGEGAANLTGSCTKFELAGYFCHHVKCHLSFFHIVVISLCYYRANHVLSACTRALHVPYRPIQ